MKLLANAHVSRSIYEFLRSEGHDCLHAELSSSGMSDDALLQLALSEQRVIVTADKDFGELVFRRRIPAVGLVLLRLRATTEADRAALFRRAWPAVMRSVEGHFVVVTNRRVRRTPLPKGS